MYSPRKWPIFDYIRLWAIPGSLESSKRQEIILKDGKNAMTITWLYTWVDDIILVTDNPAIDKLIDKLRKLPKRPVEATNFAYKQEKRSWERERVTNWK